jgi:hypothetical protein
MPLAISTVILFLLSWYEIEWIDGKRPSPAAIRLDLFPEIPLMILSLIFGAWQIFFCRKRKGL